MTASVLHILHQYLPHHVGGVELYTQTLANYQARQEGRQVAVFYPSPEEAEPNGPGHGLLARREDEGGVRVYGARLGPRSRRRVFLDTFGQGDVLQALQQVLSQEKPQLVHVQHLMGLPVALVDHIHRLQLPLVITLHDYWFPCANAQLLTNYDNTICAGPHYWINCGRCALARAGLGDRPLLAPSIAPLLGYRSHLLQRVLSRADRIIAPTNFVRDTYARLDMPVEKAVVVPHGIRVPAHVLQEAERRRPLRGDRPLHIVYVGSLARQKGLHVLIDAVNRLPGDAARLSIYGDLDKFPDYVAVLRARVQHSGIHFGGRIERDDFWRLLLDDADVAVLPTLWYEASPLTIQEMFAARVPIIASNIGALPEKIRQGVDGLLFPPGDDDALHQILRRLLHNRSLLRTLRANIQPTRLMEEHVKDVEQVYQEIMD